MNGKSLLLEILLDPVMWISGIIVAILTLVVLQRIFRE